MAVITTFQVVDCNKELERRSIKARVSLHDACGRQTLGLAAAQDELPAARAAVLEFFSARHVAVEFSGDSHTFWAR